MKKLAGLFLVATVLLSVATKAEAMSTSTVFTPEGEKNITDTQIYGSGTFTLGPTFGYRLTNNVMGFVGVDYALAPATSCASGACPAGNYARQGVGFGGGLEMAASDHVSLRLGLEHITWQSKTFTDASGDTAKISPDENAASVALVYTFK